MENRGVSTENQYEFYKGPCLDPQNNAIIGSDAKCAPGSPHMHAPGSPISNNDQQTIASLERELERHRMREKESRQKIAMKFGTSKPEAFVLDESKLDPPPCNDLDENVKDAYIKHLQRQIQNSLSKAEGWETRATELLKERDEARDHLTNLSKRIETLEAEKVKMMNELKMLRQIRLYSQEMNEENTKLKLKSASLQEEILKLRSESHQDSLQPSSGQPSSQGQQSLTSNPACSQELDYLHKVVDLLKSTVLGQRNLLLNMKQHPSGANSMPQMSGNNKSVKLPSSLTSNNTPSKSSANPANNFAELADIPMKVSSSDVPRKPSTPGWALPRPESVNHRNNLIQSSIPQAVSDKQSEPFKRSGIHQGYGQVLETFPNKLSPVMVTGHSKLDTSAQGSSDDTLNTVNPVASSANASSVPFARNPGWLDSKEPHFGMNSPSKSPQHGSTNSNNNMTSKINLIQPPDTQGVRRNPPLSKSEVIKRRKPAESSGNCYSSQSETLKQNPDKQTHHNEKRPPWMSPPKPEGEHNGAMFILPSHQLPIEAGIQEVDLRQAASSSPLYPNLQQPNVQHPQFQQPFVGMRSSNVVRVETSEPSKFMVHAIHPVTTSNTTNDSSLENQMTGMNGDFQESATHPDNLSNDRLCPVCNRVFGNYSLEDFQTHVFECFDDENGPETMTPAGMTPVTYRACPMCGDRFDEGSSQTDFERHVHGHFDEPNNFEILQP